MKKICIFGSSGFAIEIFYLAQDCGYSVECFVDVNSKEDICGVPVISEDKFDPKKFLAVIAVGSPILREKITKKLDLINTNYASLIHPSSKMMGLSHSNINLNKIGRGVIICANSIITSNINIGDFCQLNLATTIGHDFFAGDFFTTAPGVHISGNNIVGNKVYFGTNSATIDKINITDNVIIGAGACVTSDILESGTYVGIPARKIK